MSNILYIARGLPGSGKSTAIDQHVVDVCTYSGESESPEGFAEFMKWKAPSAAWCEADYFHGNPYKWLQENQHKAHQFCQLTIEAHMKNGINHVYVGNTNIRKRDYAVYIELANRLNYTVKFLIPNTRWAWDVNECAKRTLHKVPIETIQRMKDTFEEDNEFETIKLPN